ncbi:hypothetical protein Gohar_008488 [Gossypium harknessii]|uniref:Uncharacterized protein n=1 Tax=Gossypium harknessii TaxID=34285 RepID=A0A7J9GJU6_9ROSI|nr:hypothetical protein [Gossypium harknessii]
MIINYHIPTPFAAEVLVCLQRVQMGLDLREVIEAKTSRKTSIVIKVVTLELMCHDSDPSITMKDLDFTKSQLEVDFVDVATLSVGCRENEP